MLGVQAGTAGEETPAQAEPVAQPEPDAVDSPTRMLTPIEEAAAAEAAAAQAASATNGDKAQRNVDTPAIQLAEDVAQHDDDGFRFIIKQNMVVVHTDEVISD